jgi:hypothetical protein
VLTKVAYIGRLCHKKRLFRKKKKSAPGHKSSKERISVLACSNASGTHKLQLIGIGKSKKPRSFIGT